MTLTPPSAGFRRRPSWKGKKKEKIEKREEKKEEKGKKKENETKEKREREQKSKSKKIECPYKRRKERLMHEFFLSIPGFVETCVRWLYE